MSATVLIVDDEPEILDTTKWAFELAGYRALTAASAEEALPQAESLRPDVLLIDYKLPQMNGLELLRKARAWIPDAVAIMITGLTHQSENLEEQSRELGAIGFLHKPLQLESVLKMVKEELRPSTLRQAQGERGSGRTEG